MQYFAHDGKQSAYLHAVILKYSLTRFVAYLLTWTDKSRLGEEALFRFFLFIRLMQKPLRLTFPAAFLKTGVKSARSAFVYNSN
jgi:hypothetical protein